MVKQSLKGKLQRMFETFFSGAPAYFVRAPGRVNLIGEHTDYNDGFVLPMAIDREMWIALRPRQDNRVLLYSLDFPDQVADFALAQFEHSQGWVEYVKGIAWVLREEGYPLRGWEGVLASQVPVGAGLSSSAALELSLMRAFWVVSNWDWDGAEMARLARVADNQWVGIQSGVMDQMIAALGRRDHALLIDCRSLAHQLVPLPSDVLVVVLDTATRRGLVDSAYNQRVAECQQAAAYFGATALRDVDASRIAQKPPDMDDVVYRRARHVITENWRTLQAVEYLKKGDVRAFGKLLDQSHDSLRDDYEVSSPELNTIVSIARQQPGCYGARMTGAGFGGCAIALVDHEKAEAFAGNVAREYQRKTGLTAQIYITQAVDGASVVHS